MRWKRTIFLLRNHESFRVGKYWSFCSKLPSCYGRFSVVKLRGRAKVCAEDLFCGGWVSEKTKCVVLVN